MISISYLELILYADLFIQIIDLFRALLRGFDLDF